MKKLRSTVSAQSKGFTMVEMLISLSIIVMIMSLLPLIYIHIFQLSGKSTDHFDVNNAMFQKDLYDELAKADYVKVINHQLFIYQDTNVILYQYHNQRIIRKLNNSGYIIMLEGVSDGRFEEKNNGIYLTIKREKHKDVVYQVI
ncbi:competence type IV pilus minor pilin ComGF [Macrococcus equi]|uniref:competence type IV pilus minor pilin ComGF n=1 Tax=Macrococcus equi TaxID=3395462 RepID=UPI0039BE42D8